MDFGIAAMLPNNIRHCEYIIRGVFFSRRKYGKYISQYLATYRSNSIYDRGCARAIPDHVMKISERESAKICIRIPSITTMVG